VHRRIPTGRGRGKRIRIPARRDASPIPAASLQSSCSDGGPRHGGAPWSLDTRNPTNTRALHSVPLSRRNQTVAASIAGSVKAAVSNRYRYLSCVYLVDSGAE